MRSIYRVPLLLTGLWALAGCATPLDKLLEQEVTNNPIEVVSLCFQEQIDNAKNISEERAAVDKLLNCIYDVEVDPDNLECR